MLVFVSICFYGLHGLAEYTELLNPTHNPISDYQLSDLYFSTLQDEIAPDNRIAIIDLGSNPSYDTIAKVVQYVSDAKATAIGIDYSFERNLPEKGFDSLLATIKRNKEKIVLGVTMPEHGHNMFDSFFYTQLPAGEVNFGFTEFVGEYELATVREFEREKHAAIGNRKLSCFGAKLVQVSKNQEAYKTLFKQPDNEQIISYKKIKAKIPRYEVIPLFGYSSEKLIKGKIILLGSRITDYHYTPLDTLTGRSLPDMSGIDIHANIISTILEEQYIKVLRIDKIWSLAIAYFFVIILIILFKRSGHFYHILFHFLFTVFVIVLIFISYIGFEYQKKLEPLAILLPVLAAGNLIYTYVAIAKVVKKKMGNLNFSYLLAGGEEH